MRFLSIHSDKLTVEPQKKAIPQAEEINKKKEEFKECLVVFISVEKNDENNVEEISKKCAEEIVDIAKQVKCKKIVLYPYAHLSSNLASPKQALEILKECEKNLVDKKYDVTRIIFGWYKAFEIKCKGHPLSELSREIKLENVREKYDPKQLLKEVSKTKLDKSKLKDNDHRVVGQAMDLFSFNDVAPGITFWHANGLIIYNELVKYKRELYGEYGYKEISTPQILDSKIWKISGHWEHFNDNLFLTLYEKRDFAVKPMNCPGAILVYRSTNRSYKDLPLRLGEIGIVHRQELSGVLAGLFRVIKITQDDAHIFCMEEQLDDEINKLIGLVNLMYGKFKLDFRAELSTRSEKAMGDIKTWNKAEKILERVLKKNKINFKINKGEGAFYGPKIDIHIKDSLNRSWQMGTIQLDFLMPERFDLVYTNKEGRDERPIIIHRVIYGSLERFIGILLEHYNGHLPLWLTPVQVRVISFTQENIKYLDNIYEQFKKSGIRVEKDISEARMQSKVRDAALSKIPYIIVVGEKEEKQKTIAVRTKDGKTKYGVKLEGFIKELIEETSLRK